MRTPSLAADAFHRLQIENQRLTADRDALLNRLETMARIYHREVHDNSTLGLTCPLPICQENDRIIQSIGRAAIAQAERGDA